MITLLTYKPLSNIPTYKKNKTNTKDNNPQIPIHNKFLSYTLSFCGYYNSISNYKSKQSAIQIPEYSQLNQESDINSEPVDFAKFTISKLFEDDRNYVNREYMDKETFVRFKSLSYLQEKFDLDGDIHNYIDSHNSRKISKAYSKFFDHNMQSLESVAKGKQKYSSLFLKKKIGNENLVDFWLKELGQTGIKRDKIKILNTSLQDKYDSDGNIDNIVLATINKYFMTKINNENTKYRDENDLDFLLKLKTDLNRINNLPSVEQQHEFIKLLKDGNILNKDINGRKIKDVLLAPMQKSNNIYTNDLSDKLKLTFLEEIGEDEDLRKESIASAIKFVRKTILIELSKQEKLESAENFIQSENLKNFDDNLVKKLFLENSNEQAGKIIKDIKLFERGAQKIFDEMLISTPFTSSKKNSAVNESINIVLTLVNNRVNSTDSEEEANKILNAVDRLADCLDTNYLEGANVEWKYIKNYAYQEWKEKHLPKIVKSQQKNYIDVEKFLKSSVANELEKINVINTIFKSDVITIEEKAFLANKFNEPYFYDMCKFLSEQVPNNKNRKRIIENLMEQDRIQSLIFDELKNIFIEDVHNKLYNSSIINKTIQNEKMYDLFIDELVDSSDLDKFSSAEEKIAFLSKYTTEELEMVAEKVKEKYITEKSLESFETESSKYDLSMQADNIMQNLQITVDGEKVPLSDIIDKDFSYIEDVLIKNQNITQENFEVVAKLLCENTKESKEVYNTMSLILDKMQEENPNNYVQIQQSRTFLQKLKAGIFNKNNIVPSGVLANVLLASKTAAVSGEPFSMSVGATVTSAVYTLLILNNIMSEFQKG